MAATLCGGPRNWRSARDKNSHRTYEATYLVLCDREDGPAVVRACPGLPQPGDPWTFGDGPGTGSVEADDPAVCTWEDRIEPVGKEGPKTKYEVTKYWSTEPVCRLQPWDDPLTEPQKVSGSLAKYQKEAMFDRFGQLILTSSWELMRGPAVEFPEADPTVQVEQNVALLQLDVAAGAVLTVNSVPIWGCPARTVLLTDFAWEKKYGPGCDPYYVRRFAFQVHYDPLTGLGWDRYAADEGQKVLRGKWDPATGEWIDVPIGDLAAPKGFTATQANPADPGGTLTPGPYSYKVTAVNSTGGETAPRTATVTVLASSPGKVNLAWQAVPGAVSYKVYGRTAGAEGLLQTVAAPALTATDLGITSPGAAAPTVSTAKVMPDPLDPRHFVRATDRQGNFMRVMLDGTGRPAGPIGGASGTGTGGGPAYRLIQKFRETDFVADLGVPATL